MESMVAMFIIVTSVMFILSTITFLLTNEKKAQKELEASTLLFEMASSVRTFDKNRVAITEKGADLNINIIEWQEDCLRIEGEDISFDITRN